MGGEGGYRNVSDCLSHAIRSPGSEIEARMSRIRSRSYNCMFRPLDSHSQGSELLELLNSHLSSAATVLWPQNRPWRPRGEWRYSSTLSLTSALDGVGSYRHASPALFPGMTRYPLYRRLEGGGAQLIWTDVENFAPTGIRSPHRPSRSESRYRHYDRSDCGIFCQFYQSFHRGLIVGTASRLLDAQPRNSGSTPGKDRRFVLSQNLETGSGAHWRSYSMVTGGIEND